MNHYMAFVSGEPTFGWGSIVGWTGVDLFFVLSGYLIANQLFSGMTRGQTFAPRLFYARRALRTLPAYWVVLALYFLFPAFMGGREPPPLWRFVTFTQNLGLEPGTAFSHAWSLCIEEQFYLILPLLLAAGLRSGSNRSQGWTLIFALLLVGVVSRSILWFSYGTHPHDFYTHIYYSTLCRFDEFLPGIAVAMVKNFHQPLWQGITRHGQRWLLIGVAAVAVQFYCVTQYYEIEGHGYGFFMTAVGYSLNAMAFALLVIAALSPNSWLARIRIPGAYHIALWSYSTYLSHKSVQIVLARTLKPFNLPSPALACIILIAALLVGSLLYYLVEAPFMALRDRWVPSNFADQGTRLSTSSSH